MTSGWAFSGLKKRFLCIILLLHFLSLFINISENKNVAVYVLVSEREKLLGRFHLIQIFRLGSPILLKRSIIKTTVFLKKNWLFPASFIFLFVFSRKPLIVHTNFDEDWFQTTDVWCRKRHLYQLRNNCYLLLKWIKLLN